MEQLLEAMSNEENKTQQKVNAKEARGQKVKKEKDIYIYLKAKPLL